MLPLLTVPPLSFLCGYRDPGSSEDQREPGREPHSPDSADQAGSINSKSIDLWPKSGQSGSHDTELCTKPLEQTRQDWNRQPGRNHTVSCIYHIACDCLPHFPRKIFREGAGDLVYPTPHNFIFLAKHC